MSGTILSQIVLFAASPILTRTYDSAAFGQYALLSFGLSILTVLCTGKYDLGILIPESEIDAFSLFLLAGILSVVVSLAVSVGALIWLHFQAPEVWLGQTGWRRTLIVPAGAAMVIFGAWQAILFTWMNRQQQYRTIAICRVTHVVVMIATQLLLSMAFGGLFGLLLGTLAGLSACLAIQVIACNLRALKRPSLGDLVRVARLHSNLPKHSIPTDLIGTLLAQFPIFVLGIKFSETTVGFYSLVQRTLHAPMQLISNSIGDIFRRQAAGHYATHGECKKIFRETFCILAVAGVFSIALLTATGPDLFAAIFGEGWRVSGEYARIVIIIYALKYVMNPLSFTFYLAKKTKLDLVLHSTFLGLLAISFVIIKYWVETVTGVLIAFVAVNIFMYVLYIFLSWRFARGLN